MNATVVVPLWVLWALGAVFVLTVVREFFSMRRDECARDLWRMYWRAQYGTDDELPSEARPPNG